MGGETWIYCNVLSLLLEGAELYTPGYTYRYILQKLTFTVRMCNGVRCPHHVEQLLILYYHTVGLARGDSDV